MASFELDYWPPHPSLEGLVSGYHRYAVGPARGERHHDVFFPSWALMRVSETPDPWRVTIGDRRFDVPQAALFGPTSQVGYSDSGGGAVVGAGLTPLGWYRLTRRAAADFANRVAPLDALLGPALADEIGRFGALPRDQVRPAFDELLIPLLGNPRREETRVVEMHAFLMDARGGVAAMAEELGLSQRTLNRLGLTAFGFGPKLLVRRARFLRSLTALMEDNGETWSSRIESSYYDHSHFIRDAQDFLGMSPGEFLRLPRPMNRASASLRTQVLGAPAQALFDPRLTAPALASQGAGRGGM